MDVKAKRKKYVWFRRLDPTYFFRPTLNFFSFEYEKNNYIQENFKDRF